MRIISSQSFFLYAARPTVISTVDSGAEKSPAPMLQPHCDGRSLGSEQQ